LSYTDKADVHGITIAELTDAPDFFDLRLLTQSAEAHDLEAVALINAAATYSCAMQAYAEYWGDYDRYYGKFRWQSLGKAIRQQQLTLPAGMRLHSALADAEMTRQLVLKMTQDQLSPGDNK
jgi:DNA polymerase-3 subunit epsilon